VRGGKRIILFDHEKETRKKSMMISMKGKRKKSFSSLTSAGKKEKREKDGLPTYAIFTTIEVDCDEGACRQKKGKRSSRPTLPS